VAVPRAQRAGSASAGAGSRADGSVPTSSPSRRQRSVGRNWHSPQIGPPSAFSRTSSSIRSAERVALWRQGGRLGITHVTRDLLEYWSRPDRERRLFFCQIEALETAIYLTEVAPHYGDAWIENALRAANDAANPGLYRIAFKMATGLGLASFLPSRSSAARLGLGPNLRRRWLSRHGRSLSPDRLRRRRVGRNCLGFVLPSRWSTVMGRRA